MNDRRRRPEPENSPIYSEKSERITVGEALQNQDFFWRYHGQITPASFSVPRLARIWDAMVRAAENGKKPSRNWIAPYIKNDSGEDDPLAFYLNLVINDAIEEGHEHADIHAETVQNLAAKRAVLDSLDAAKNKILRSDFGTPPEQLQEIAMKAVGSSISADYDKDLRPYEEWGYEVFKDAAANIDRDEDDIGGIGLPCGLRAVEEVIGRLLPGKLYILAGMSGSGKSALARMLAESASEEAMKRGMGGTYIASLEMTGKEYAARSLAQRVGMSFEEIERGDLGGRAAVERLEGHARDLKRFGITVDSRTNMTIDDIKSRMVKTSTKYGGLALAIVDHLIILGAEKGQTLFDKVSDSTMKAKNMAKEFGIPVIMLAQLTEKKILETASGWPNASHLFGGETITQNADVIFFVHRHELVLSKKEPAKDTPAHDKWLTRIENARGKATVFNDKRRGGGGQTKREMLFHGPTMTFSDI